MNIQRVASAQKLLVALDFDGTLAPLVPHPADARMSSQAHSAVQELASLPHTYVAFVSGRNLESLIQVANPEPAVFLVGSHGAEVQLPGQERQFTRLNTEQREMLKAVKKVLDNFCQEHPGATVEHKPAAAVLHFRNVDSTEIDHTAATFASKLRALFPSLHLMEGKKVIECAVLDVNKGHGLNILREITGVDSVVFAGDDVTDENGFKVLTENDLSVKVGPGQTSAVLRVQDSEQLCQLLEELASVRTRHQSH